MFQLRVSQYYLVLVTILLFGIGPTMVWAGSETKYPTSQSSSGWTNPDNILAYDNTCARPPAPTTQDTMTLVFPAFSIPAGAVLQGIEVGMSWSRSDPFTYQLGKDTGGGFVNAGSTKASGDPKSNGNTCSNNVDFTVAGGPSDLWGSSLTASDFNNGYIRLKVTTPAAGNQAWVDAIRLTAVYSPVADIEVTSTESIDPVIAGSGAGNLTYVVTVKNLGPDPATGVTVGADVDFPSGVSIVSVTASAGTSWAPSNNVPGTWTVGNLAVDATKTLTFVLTVGPNTAEGTDTIQLSACSDRTGAAEIDPNENCPSGPPYDCPVDPATNNCTEQSTSVDRQFDLVITKTDFPDPVVAGSQLTYTIGVTNKGPSTAFDVEVIDTLPSSYVTYAGNTASGGCVNDSPGPGQVTCGLGDIAPSNGVYTYFKIYVDIDSETPHNTIIENSAFAISEKNDKETNLPDNSVGPVSTVVVSSITTFIIEKIWDQAGNTDAIPVNAHLSCTGATSTQQDVVFTATTNAVLFVYDISEIPEGQQVDCTVTEDVPEGYRARYEHNCGEESSCGDSSTRVQACFYPAVSSDGIYTCTITNRPRPAVVTVTKTWIIEGASQGFDGGFWLGMNCDSRVDGPQGYDGCYGSPDDCWAEIREDDAILGSTDYEFTILKPNYPFTRCAFWEDPDDNVVEVENGCGRMKLGPADEAECEFVNTVFFEGIPTLNEYGMAILALLMLGMGFVGFRRFA